MSSTGKLILRGASLNVIKMIVGILAGFFMMPFLINNLGNHLYGLWVSIGSIAGAYYLLDMGFSQAVTRYVAKCIHQQDYAGANKVINTSLAIYSALAAAIVLIAFLIAGFLADYFVKDPQDLKLVQILIIITGIALAFEFPSKAFPGILNAYMRYDTTALVSICKTMFDVGLVVLLLNNGFSLIAMAAVYFLTSILSTIFYIYYCNNLFKQIEYSRANINLETTKEMFHFSKWVFLMDASQLLKDKMDIWLIAFYGSASLVTIYYVAVRLLDFGLQLLIQMMGVTSTLFTKYYALGDTQKLTWVVSSCVKINFVLAVTLFNGLYLVGYDFISLWMGKNFEVDIAFTCLMILSLGKLIGFVARPFNGLLLTIKKHKYSANLSFIETIASGILCVVLIPSMGLTGAAIAIAAPLVITKTFALPIYAQQFIPTLTPSLLIRAVIAACLAAFVTILFKMYLLTDVKLGVISLISVSVAYACIIPLLGLIMSSKEDRSLVSTYARQYFQKFKH
jgi:O-antigen/teichoic acid export membrane protein